MAVVDRHRIMVNMLKKSAVPLSGSHLSKELGVSRQIIVQDITTLREKGFPILSTPKGYILDHASDIERVFKVHHTVEDTERELNLFVDLGAVVKDVFIYHKVYNEIHAKLGISSRKDVKEFCDKIMSGESSPLMSATGGYHYHTIVTKDIETMDLVEEALKSGGFLADLTAYEPEELTNSAHT